MIPLALVFVASTAAAAAPAAPGHTVVFVDKGLVEPFAIDFDAAGRAYVAEMSGNRVSVVEPDGSVRVLAGTGEKGAPAAEAKAEDARFNGPHHLLIGPDGALYVADTFNNCVRRIDLATRVVTRFAGTGVKGFGGDGGPAKDAVFDGIFNIAFRDNRLYIMDLGNRRVRAVDLATGIVKTVAGSGSKGVPKDGGDALSEPLVDPRAIAFDPAGNLYICERSGHALRVVDVSGKIRTVAGTGERGYSGDGGDARVARLDGPKHLFAEASGDVLITDTENHAIRRYSPADGTIRHVAGGRRGAAGVPGPAKESELDRPHGAHVHPRTGEIYVSDSANNRVLRIGRSRRVLAIGAATGWQHESTSSALAARLLQQPRPPARGVGARRPAADVARGRDVGARPRSRRALTDQAAASAARDGRGWQAQPSTRWLSAHAVPGRAVSVVAPERAASIAAAARRPLRTAPSIVAGRPVSVQSPAR